MTETVYRLQPALFRFPDVLAGITAPQVTMIAVANAIPYPSVVLAEAKASITARIAATYPHGTAGRASWQATHATLLGGLGRREEALVAIEEAVSIRRQLAAALPGVFLIRLANSLDSLAARLAALGHDISARTARDEARRIREQAQAKPDRH